MSTLRIWQLPVCRFGSIAFAALIGSVLLWSSLARSEEPNLNSWQGEWFSVSSEGSRFGITLKNCQTDEIVTKCDAEVFGLGDTGKFCLSQVTAFGAADREELVINAGHRGIMSLKKKGNTIVSSEAIEPDCDFKQSSADISYVLQSRQVYLKSLENDTGQCNLDTSPAMHQVCTDAKVLSIVERAQSVPFPSEHVGAFWGDDPIMLKKCNEAASPQDCVLEAYQRKLDGLEVDSRSMSSYGSPGDARKAKTQLRTMSGVYKRRFKNGDTAGFTYQSEDVFEFVPISPVAAYIKLHLEFFNGHDCRVAGVAEYKKVGAFVFQDPDGPNGNRCLLSIKLDGSTISFQDPNGSCMKFCAAQEGFRNENFYLTQRRKIRYMSTIEKSADYIAALADYEKHHGKSQLLK